MRHPLNCHVIHDIDLFGKDPELYYKGKNKKSTLVGRIFTVLYIVIYIAFFLYKLIRMLQKVDVTFYQTTAFTGDIPSIHLTNDLFYGGFALSNARTLQPCIDETIYFIDCQFRTGKRVNNNWDWKIERLELEVCNLEKFDPRYYDLFKDKPMNNMYCPKEMDLVLQGHTTYDVYSYFYVAFYPCVNTTTRQNCKPPEVIDQYLKNAYVSFKMQDIELTPQLYDTPIQLRGKEVNSPASKNLFQNINAYFQVIELETDDDIVGFEWLSNLKKEKYLKYDGPIVLSRLNDNIQYHAGQALCDVTIQLTEQVLTIKRTYTKLIEVLGDVGGLMEVIYMFFKMISSLITDLLYEKSMVNNLFSFDLDKKLVIIKEFQNKKKKGLQNKDLNEDCNAKEEIRIFSPRKGATNLVKKTTIFTNGDLNVQTRNKLNNNDDELLKSNNKLNDENLKIMKLPKKKKHRSKKTIAKAENIENNNEIVSKKTLKEKDKDKDKNDIYNLKDDGNDNIINSNEEKKEYDKITERGVEKDKKIVRTKTKKSNNEKKSKNFVNKIKINKCYLCICFLFIKSRKNLQNILVNEGMGIITQYLDVLNIFKKLYRDGKIQEQLQKEKDDIIEMSDECTHKLSKLE